MVFFPRLLLILLVFNENSNIYSIFNLHMYVLFFKFKSIIF